MSKTKSKIVDLEKCSDGSYSPKNIKTKAITTKMINHKGNISYKDKHKHMIPSEVDDFLGGIDAGLYLLEEVVPRAKRFLKLRG